jgi:hypothetical protein
MASLLGLNGANAVRPIQYSGLNVSSSKMDSPIPIFWGMRRLTTNAMWYNNFQKHSQSKGGKGGKGGGQYDYTAAVIVGLCEGPIDLIQNIWAQASTTTTTTLAKLNMTLFTGTAAQSPWSYVTTNYPAEARSYAYTAYLADPNMDLGSSATIPDNQFECQRLLSFSYTHTTPGYIHPDSHAQDNGIDVLMSDCITDVLTSTQYGLGFASGDLGSITQYATYNRAQGLFFSPVIDQQDKMTAVLDRWAGMTNSWIYWSGTQLLFYPLADGAITGNGVTFTPENDICYSLGPNDAIGDVPFKVQRIDPADAYNRTRLDITDRTLGYTSNPIEYKDQTLVDQYGLRDNPAVDGKDCCDPIVGKIIVQLIGKRAAYIRNSYSFKTNYRFVRCLPGSVLELNDPNIGLVNTRVRVVTVQENEDNTLDFTCEEFPGTVASFGAFDPSAGNIATTPNTFADPGNVNTPAIVEPDSAFTGGIAKLLIAASGGANWGGCQVWLSFDNGANFVHQGDITTAAGQGVLTATLATHAAGLDTTNTISVDCTESLTTLPVVGNSDATALRTLTMICAQPTLIGGDYVMPNNGELTAWGNTSTTGTYTADLTYLERGVYGSTPSSHASGDQFSVIDVSGLTGTTFSYDLPPQYIGVPILVKLLSFNSFGNEVQDISTVNIYKYTPAGTGFGGGAAGVPTAPTGGVASGGANSVGVAWNDNPATDNVLNYQVWYGLGGSIPFGSCTLLATTASPNYNAVGLATNQLYSFFIVAVNSVGSSSPSSRITATTTTASLNVFGVTFSCQDISTKPTSTIIARFAAGIVWKLPATGSSPAGFVEGKVVTAPGSDTIFDLQNDGVSVGSIKFASGSTTPTLIKAADTTFALGDYLDLVTPSNLNGMSGAFGVTLMGTR